MPIIKREQLIAQIKEQDQQEVEQLAELINSALLKKYQPDSALILPIGEKFAYWPPKRVQDEIIRQGNEAGWKIEFYSDQRDGDGIRIEALDNSQK